MHRLWAIYPEALEAMLANGPLSTLGMRPAARRGGPSAAARAEDRAGNESILTVAGGIATISISGVLTKAFDSWLAFWGEAQTTYGQIVQAARAALADPAVKGVKLLIDSPGGDVDGHEAAMEALTALAAAKATVVEAGWCCSAAAWLAFAVPAANVAMTTDGLGGSIGVIATMHDMSARYAQAGVKPVVVASGDNKAFFGTTGLPIEPKHIDNVRSTFIDPAFARFKADAVKARGLAADSPVFDGRVLTPADAKTSGLVGFVGSATAVSAWADERLAHLAGLTPEPSRTDKPAASASAATQTKDNTMPATLEQLRAKFGSDIGFCIAQLDAKATMEAAQEAWNKRNEEKVAAAEKAAADAKADAEKAKAEAEKAKSEAAAAATKPPATPGHNAALQTGGAAAADKNNEDAGEKGTAAAYEARAQRYIAAGMTSPAAWAKAKSEDAKGHLAYIAAGRKRILGR